jgi:triacylglycerol lipase
MKIVKTVLALGFTILLAISVAQAVEIGPDPTSTLLNGDGPFAVTSTSASGASGFGGGTIYYPNEAGSYGVIAVCPGFTNTSSAISWFARRLATHGFVTIAMNTNSRFDQPDSRATQLRAAVNYMINSSPSAARSRIRAADRGVSGYSMGGGGTLLASSQDATLKVGISLAPYCSTKNFSSVSVPQMLFGGSSDSIASVSSHAQRFYDSITQAEKALAVLNGASHLSFTSLDQRDARYGVAFAKRFVDGDTRYNEFLCGAEHTAYATSARFTTYLSTCPY